VEFVVKSGNETYRRAVAVHRAAHSQSSSSERSTRATLEKSTGCFGRDFVDFENRRSMERPSCGKVSSLSNVSPAISGVGSIKDDGKDFEGISGTSS